MGLLRPFGCDIPRSVTQRAGEYPRKARDGAGQGPRSVTLLVHSVSGPLVTSSSSDLHDTGCSPHTKSEGDAGRINRRRCVVRWWWIVGWWPGIIYRRREIHGGRCVDIARTIPALVFPPFVFPPRMLTPLVSTPAIPVGSCGNRCQHCCCCSSAGQEEQQGAHHTISLAAVNPYHDIQRPHRGKSAAWLRRHVGPGSARHFPEHCPGSVGFQGGHLRRHALAVRRYPRIAVDHAAILHRRYAPGKPNPIRSLVLVRIS